MVRPDGQTVGEDPERMRKFVSMKRGDRAGSPGLAHGEIPAGLTASARSVNLASQYGRHLRLQGPARDRGAPPEVVLTRGCDVAVAAGTLKTGKQATHGQA